MILLAALLPTLLTQHNYLSCSSQRAIAILSVRDCDTHSNSDTSCLRKDLGVGTSNADPY